MVAYDPFPNAKIATYVDYKDTIEEAVEGADIVTLHVPATKYNHYLFNAELFKHFKRGAVFVNCARGSLVDTKALLDALDNGVIKGALIRMNLNANFSQVIKGQNTERSIVRIVD